jgi:hypothetical protein
MWRKQGKIISKTISPALRRNTTFKKPNLCLYYNKGKQKYANQMPVTARREVKNSGFGGQSSACERFDLQIRAIPYRKFVDLNKFAPQ